MVIERASGSFTFRTFNRESLSRKHETFDGSMIHISSDHCGFCKHVLHLNEDLILPSSIGITKERYIWKTPIHSVFHIQLRHSLAFTLAKKRWSREHAKTREQRHPTDLGWMLILVPLKSTIPSIDPQEDLSPLYRTRRIQPLVHSWYSVASIANWPCQPQLGIESFRERMALKIDPILTRNIIKVDNRSRSDHYPPFIPLTSYSTSKSYMLEASKKLE